MIKVKYVILVVFLSLTACGDKGGESGEDSAAIAVVTSVASGDAKSDVAIEVNDESEVPQSDPDIDVQVNSKDAAVAADESGEDSAPITGVTSDAFDDVKSNVAVEVNDEAEVSQLDPDNEVQANISNVTVSDSALPVSSKPADKLVAVAISESLDQGESSNNYLSIALIILSLATLISIAISFWLYKWRRLLLGDLKALSPEEFGGHARGLIESINGFSDQFNYRIKEVNQEVARLTSKSENMTETYMSLHHSIDVKDQEIARLKSGYDSQIYKKFLKRFLKVDQIIQEEILESDSTIASHLEPIQEILQDALDECGVEKFSPEIGGQYKDTEGVADRPKLKNTDDAKKNGEISRVIEQGYRISINEGFEILAEAKVEIYHFNESGE